MTSVDALSSCLSITGNYSFQVTGNQVTIAVDYIDNNCSTYTSGSLRLELWATSTPYAGGGISGYRTASIRTASISGLSDALGPNSYFSGINVTIPYNAPPSGYDNYTLILSEYSSNCTSSDGFCIADYGSFSQSSPDVTFGGIVLNQLHQPVSGATVTLTASGATYSAVTDAAGHFSITFDPTDLPTSLAAIITIPGYAPLAVNLNLGGSSSIDLGTLTMEPLGPALVLFDLAPALHHLGDGYFSGAINSLFQTNVEGASYSKTFSLTADQMTATGATITLLAKGLQCDNPLSVNGHLVAYLNSSPADGSFGTVTINVPKGNFVLGSNTFTIASSSTGSAGACTGTDLDDFEFTNGILRLTGVTTATTSALTVTKSGAGSGTVSSSPAGISCGAACSGNFAGGTKVALTATPAAGSTFAGWSGACTGTGICTVTMDAAKTVTATFNTAPFVATASVNVTATSATITTRITFNPTDVGKPGAVFVTGWVRANALSALGISIILNGDLSITSTRDDPSLAGAANSLQATHQTLAATDPNSFVLVQLTSTGWQLVVNGQLTPYASGVLGDQLAAQTILNNTIATNLAGAQFCLGYGSSIADMVVAGRAQVVATIPDPNSTSAATGTCLVLAPLVNGAVVTQFASRATVTPSSAVYGAFALSNPTNLNIAVRGPSLGTLGITPNPQPHPSLGLYGQTGTLLVSSNQCTGSTADSAAVSSYYQNRGAPLNANDPCLGYASSALSAGVYTFVVTPDASNPSGSGEVLFETIPAGAGATVTQFASRATLTPSRVVYGAFALANPTHLYIAVRGPSMGTLGITANPHPHPSLGLYSQTGTLLVSSNQCTGSTADSAAVLSYYQNRGAALNANDACLGYVTSALPAGVYTFVITPDASNPSGSGEVLFETIPLN